MSSNFADRMLVLTRALETPLFIVVLPCESSRVIGCIDSISAMYTQPMPGNETYKCREGTWETYNNVGDLGKQKVVML